MVTKKDPNFEINLLPVISVLAICICFLLMNSVWTLVGSVDLKQASGSLPVLTDRTPLLVLSLYSQNFHLQTKNAKKDVIVNVARGDLNKLVKSIRGIRATEPMDAAIVLSEKSTSYQDIVKAIETLKDSGFQQVGLSSL